MTGLITVLLMMTRAVLTAAEQATVLLAGVVSTVTMTFMAHQISVDPCHDKGGSP
jgi:hypothetical protein